MPLMNSHQILKGARKPGLLDTYVVGLVATKPQITISGSSIQFAGGQMEFDGRLFPLEGTLDFNSFATMLPQPIAPSTTSTACYNVYAVPKYHEPLSRNDAEDPNKPYAAAGINYYVTTDPNSGESYLYYFISSYVEQAIRDGGGIDYLEFQMTRGTASGKERRLYELYYEEYNKITSPSFVGKDIFPVGTEFVLAQISPSPTIPDPDATDTMTESEFKYFSSSQSVMPTKMHQTVYTLTSPTTGTFFSGPVPTGFSIPGQKIWKMRTVVLYPSQADADANTNAYPITFPESLQDITEAYDYVTAPSPDGLGWSGVYAMVWEYYVPAYMPQGQIGYNPQIHDFLTKRDHTILGRVNPIYMADAFKIPRICSGLSRRPAMMDYACPSALIQVCLTVTAGSPPTVAVNSSYTPIFDTLGGIG